MSEKNEPDPDTRVRRLRKDGSWIRRQDDSATSKPEDLETKPLVKRNSYVLMAIKRYESLDSPSVSPPAETDSNQFDKYSTNQKEEKANFPHDGVVPDGSSAQTPNNTKPKEPTKHLVTLPVENTKTGTVKTSPSVDAPLLDPVSSANITSVELVTSKVQPVNDTAVEKIKSTPEKTTDFKVAQKTEIANLLLSADTDNQTALSDKRGIKNTADVKVKSSPDVRAVNVATVINETSPSNTKQPVAGGLSDAPAVKADVKTAESREHPTPRLEPSTVITAVCTPEDKTLPPNNEQPLSQDLPKTPADKAVLTSGVSGEKPVILTKLVSALKAEKENQLADDGPAEPSVVSTPEQVSQCLPKILVQVEPSPNVDTQISSEQDANKTAKTTLNVEVETSSEVPPANKTTLANEATLLKSEPVLSGLSEAPAVKPDVEPVESQEDPPPLPEPFTVVTAEKVDVTPVEDETTPPNKVKPVSNNSSQPPAPELAEPKENSASVQESVPMISSESEVQTGVVEQINELTPQCAGDGKFELSRKENVESLPFVHTNNETSPSKQVTNKVAQAAKIEVESPSEVSSTNKKTVTNETSPPTSMPLGPSGLSEAPAVKPDVKPVESPQDSAPHSEPSTVIRAEKEAVSTPEDETTPSDSEQSLSQDLSKTPAEKATLTSGGSEEKPVTLTKLVSALKAESEVQSANDAPAEPSVVSTPEQVSQCIPKILVQVEPFPNDDPQTASEQHTIQIVKKIEKETSPEVPPSNKTVEITVSESKPVPSGLSEAPAVKPDVKNTEPSTVIRAEKEAVSTPEDKITPSNSEQPLSQDLPKTPAEKAALTSGGSEEKPVALTKLVSALKAESEVQSANDAPAEPSVVSTPEQVSQCIPKIIVQVEPSPNVDTQISSEQDANKTAKTALNVEVETSSEVPPANKTTLANEATLPKSEPVPSGLSEAPAVKPDVKPVESSQDPAQGSEPSTVIRAEKETVSTPEDKTTPTNSEQPLSQDLPKTPADKAVLTSGGSEEKPVALTKQVSALKAEREVQSANDAPAEPSVVSTPEQVSQCIPKILVQVEPFPNDDPQTSSEQDANKTAKTALNVEVETSSEVPPANKTTLANEATPPKSEPVLSGLSEAPAVKPDVEPVESPQDSAPHSEPSTVIRAEKEAVSTPEDETTPSDSEQSLSQDLSKTPAEKATLTSGGSEEKPVTLTKLVSALKAEREVQSANDAPTEPSVVSTPEQVSQCIPKILVQVEPFPNDDPQTSSEQDANKTAKTALNVEVETSSEVPPANKTTLANEATLPKREPVLSGLSEAPAVKPDVKPVESSQDPAQGSEPSTVIRAEKEAVSTPEDETTPSDSEQSLSQDLSKTPAEKATLTSGRSEEKPVTLTKLVSALKAEREVQSANDAPAEPSVVSTPEQVSQCIPKILVQVEPFPNDDPQTASEQDAIQTVKKIEIETSPEVPPSNKTVEITVSESKPVPSGLSEAPAAIADVKPVESQNDTVTTLESTADLNTNTIIKPEPSKDTNKSPLKQQFEKATAGIVEEAELESIPEVLAPNEATLVNETSNTEIRSDSQPNSPPAETLVKTVERRENSAAPPTAVPATCAESDVQSLDDDDDDAPVKQCKQATSDLVTKQMPASKTDEDVQTVPVVYDKDSVHKVIELTDAMDMEAPGLESVSKPVDAPEPRLPQESELKQPQADNKNFENSGKIAESLSSTKNHTRLFSNNDICTYCNQIIDGNAKIVFNEPAVICHPKCLKCGVCATNLGGLEIPMFLSNEAILCVDCYRKA